MALCIRIIVKRHVDKLYTLARLGIENVPGFGYKKIHSNMGKSGIGTYFKESGRQGIQGFCFL